MRAISSAASISIHVAVAAAVLLSSTKSARPDPIASPPIPRVVFVETTDAQDESPAAAGEPVGSIAPLDLGAIRIPDSVLHSGALSPTPRSPEWTPGIGTANANAPGWNALAETGPEVLSGPRPTYPDLLRQAGIEGQVVLEARVDSTGRVQRASITVVSATNPGFVESARQSLLATLFRPARVNGHAVATLVRVPFAFSIRGGTGRAR